MHVVRHNRDILPILPYLYGALLHTNPILFESYPCPSAKLSQCKLSYNRLEQDYSIARGRIESLDHSFIIIREVLILTLSILIAL